jgi:hypothetical protein
MAKNRLWLCAAVLCVAACGQARADLYVSSDGNDANPGTKERPLRTIERARDSLRQQIRDDRTQRQPLTVWIAGGSYFVDRTLELGTEDSGVEGAAVTYRTVPKAQVRLVGGRPLPPEKFKPVEDPAVLGRLDAAARGHVLQIDLKSLGVTDLGEVATGGKRADLFFNDQALTLARWPNEGFVEIADVVGGQPVTVHGLTGDKVGKFTYKGDRPRRWTAEADLWLDGYWYWDWAEQYQKVESIDADKRTVSIARPYQHYGYRKGQRYYAVNALVELDSPGEWYLDRRTSLLFLWPPGPMDKARIIFSTLQSPIVQLTNASYVVLRDLIVEGGRGNGIEVHRGQGNLIAGCTVRNLGRAGIVLAAGRRNGVTGCDVCHVGREGIRLGGGDRASLDPAGNYAVNNHIHHFARLKRAYSPAVLLEGVGNRAAGNLIHDAPCAAILFYGNDAVIERNEIHDVCQEQGDIGVINTGRDWTVRGNLIRYNFIHHVHGPGLYGAQGIYLDDAASGSVVFGNIIYQTDRAMLLGGGRDNRIENNLLLDCDRSITFDNRGLNWMREHVESGGVMPRLLAATPYRRPPWSVRYPQLLTLLNDDPGSPKGNVIRRNVVWRCKPMYLAKEVVRFGTVADNLTTDEDLGFADAGKMNFQLRSDSVVFRKLPQFQPIPVETIGLRPGRSD